MFYLRPLVTMALFGTIVAMTLGQVNEAVLPEIWKQIEQEAEIIAREAEQRNPRYLDLAWEAAEEIAERHDRSTINTLFKSVGHLENLPPRDKPRYLRNWMKGLFTFVTAKIADPRNHCGLKATLSDPVFAYHAYDYPTEALRTQAIVAMDCFRDETSQKWLLDLVLSDDDLSYFALQLLRGYVPDKVTRAKLEQALDSKPSMVEKAAAWRITRVDALRSVLSSWNYAASLEDPVDRARYRDFQSRLWRYHAFLAVSRKTSRELTSKFRVPADKLAEQWQPGDERFVLHIFEDPASTRDELKIAVFLAHKIPDTDKLKSIADSDSPQAPYAREALDRLQQE